MYVPARGVEADRQSTAVHAITQVVPAERRLPHQAYMGRHVQATAVVSMLSHCAATTVYTSDYSWFRLYVKADQCAVAMLQDMSSKICLMEQNYYILHPHKRFLTGRNNNLAGNGACPWYTPDVYTDRQWLTCSYSSHQQVTSRVAACWQERRRHAGLHLIKAAAAEPDCVSLLPGVGHMEHHHCCHLKPLDVILILGIAWQNTKACWQLGVKHKRQSPALHHLLQVRSHT